MANSKSSSTITIVFDTPEEIQEVEMIKAMTFSRSYKIGILRLIKAWDALSKECSELKKEVISPDHN